MKKLILAGVLIAVLMLSQSAAAVPQTMSYQGVLRDAVGNVVPDGSYSLTFRVYNVSAAGAALWTESQTVPVEDGIFNVILGSVTPLALPFDVQYWLGVSVGAGPELTPRTQLASSPYALRAQYADQGDDDWAYSGGDIYRTTGSVGIGALPFLVRAETKDGKASAVTRDRASTKLYVTSPGLYTTFTELYEADAAEDGRAAIYAYRSRDVRNDGTGYGVGVTNNAVTGFNYWGDNYTFGVAGYTYGDYGLTGGVLGAASNGSVWGSLGYRDASYNWWGLYTPYNAYVGGFTMPTGAAAGEVLTCDANGVATWLPVSGGIGGAGTTNYVPRFTSATIIGNSMIYDNGSAVGIGTTSPYALLAVEETSTGRALDAVTSYSGTVGQTVNFERTTGISDLNDVLQIMVPDGSIGTAQFIECETGDGNYEFRLHTNGDMEVFGDVAVDGTIDVDSGGTRAGDFVSDYASSSTRVVSAEYTATSSDGIAVYGRSVPTDFYGYGGYFEGGYYGVYGTIFPTGSNTYHGVYGRAAGGSGSNYGIRGYATGTGTNYGVYGFASGGTSYAGYFSGNAVVTGTLSKGAGSFKIDHPLDPANKYLYHSFVESPDMMNVYNGNVVLDALGEALVEMPEWFEVLNRDFRYQLTAIGAPGPNLYIAQKMSGNSFVIAGGGPGMEVSWMVTGVRQDAFANANRIPVEENKPVNERGKYIHPELYGMPETSSVSYTEERPVPVPTEQYEDSRARHAVPAGASDGAE